MSAHVTVKPSVREFFVEGSETLLKAALRGGDIPEQSIVAKLHPIDALSADVMRQHLQTLRSNSLRFLAGQWVTLGLSAGVASSAALVPRRQPVVVGNYALSSIYRSGGQREHEPGSSGSRSPAVSSCRSFAPA